eukprot:jgi/Tetstr1/432549/TSEL_021920.t1
MATDAVGQLSGAHRRNLAACPSLAIESGVRRVHATLDPAGAAPCRAEERRVEECEALERQPLERRPASPRAEVPAYTAPQ